MTQTFLPEKQHVTRFTLLVLYLFAAVSAVVLAIVPGPAISQEFECSVPGDKRYIRLELPGQDHLCEVSVTGNDNSRRVMWYANNESLFCSAKIYELRSKYENQWNFTCSEWLDTGGIDKLSERHRNILDNELKARIRRGQEANPSFRITGVKAVASSPLNLAEGTLALQFFMLDEGSLFPRDVTHVIFDDGKEWQSIAQLDSLRGYVDSVETEGDTTIVSALVHDITEAGVLSVNTTLQDATNSDSNAACQGSQLLLVSETDIATNSPHRVLCNN